MFMVRGAAGTMLLAILACGPALCAAADGKPLSLRDIGRMRHDREPLEAIVDTATEQGISFTVTSNNERQLSRMGFSAEQIDAIRQAPTSRTKAEDRGPLLREGLDRDHPARAARGKAGAAGVEQAPAAVPGQGLTSSDEDRDRVLMQVTKITNLSAADVRPEESAHITLWAAKDDRAAFMPDVKAFEQYLEAKWPEPLRSGLDKRAAHLVLLKTRYDYERWVKAMFEVMPETTRLAGAPEGGGDAKASILKWTAYYSRNFLVICMEGKDATWTRHMAAAGVGYMNFAQEVEPQRHDPLATGFANHAESLVAGSPQIMLFSNSYQNEDRDLGKDPRRWLHLVQDRMRRKKESGIRQLLNMDTSNMLLPEYAEAWSLVSVLARQPEKFSRLTMRLRDEKDPLAAIEDVYGWDEKKLEAQWHNEVLKQR